MTYTAKHPTTQEIVEVEIVKTKSRMVAGRSFTQFLVRQAGTQWLTTEVALKGAN